MIELKIGYKGDFQRFKYMACRDEDSQKIDNVKLTSDIDFEGDTVEPIQEFYGWIDGNGYCIKNLEIRDEINSEKAAFIINNNGVIKNLTIENASVKAEEEASPLVVNNKGKISNCECRDVEVTSGGEAGGFVFDNKKEGEIQNVYSNSEVESPQGPSGGIANENKGLIKKSKFEGSIESSGENIGGIVGFNFDIIESCSSKNGTIIGSSTIGGISGYNNGEIKMCDSDLHKDGNRIIGGIAGSNHGEIIYSYTTGSIEDNLIYRLSEFPIVGLLIGKKRATKTGELVGYNFGIIKNCYWINGKDESVGYNIVEDGTIIECEEKDDKTEVSAEIAARKL